MKLLSSIPLISNEWCVFFFLENVFLVLSIESQSLLHRRTRGTGGLSGPSGI